MTGPQAASGRRKTGREILRDAMDEWRKSGNKQAGIAMANGTERLLQLFEANEEKIKELGRDVEENTERAEATVKRVCDDHADLVAAVYEEHLLRHPGGWAVCPAGPCRAAAEIEANWQDVAAVTR